MATRDDYAASRRYFPTVLIVVLMTSVGSSKSMSGSSSSSGSSCSCGSARGHLRRSPTSTTPPHVWHPPLHRHAQSRCTTTSTRTTGFFHHHYRWCSNTLTSSSCAHPDGDAAAAWRCSPRAFRKHRRPLAAAARRRPVGMFGMAEGATKCDGSTSTSSSRSRSSDRHRALAAVAGGRGKRGAEGAAAVAAGAVGRRTNGHDSTGRTSTISNGVGRSSDAVPTISREIGEERVEEARETKRHPGMLSRGMAATERFFANDGRRRNAGPDDRGLEDVGGEEGGFGSAEKQEGMAAGAAAAAAAKLEGEQEARELEGLRKVPRHVAFVMDGNGRWAASRNLPRGTGHVEGARRAGEAVEACRQLGVEFVTLYAFSTENWRRPEGEVSFLMDLMEKTLVEQRDGLRRNGIRLAAIGELDRLPERLRSLLREIQEDSDSTCSGNVSASENTVAAAVAAADNRALDGPPSVEIPRIPGLERAGEEMPRVLGEEERLGATARAAGTSASLSGSSRTSGSHNNGDRDSDTAPRPAAPQPPAIAIPPPPPSPPPVTPIPTTMTLCLAISYGGRSELAAAARELAAEAAAGRLDPADIDESALSGRLSTTRLGIPDPDLVVRTSGESRLSNLLVWQSAYSELCVVEKAWPDFRRADLVETFRDFGRRRRRFGKTPEQIAEAP